MSGCVLIIAFLDFIRGKNVEWTLKLVVFFGLVIWNFFSNYAGFWPAFHHGDESYFYESALKLYDLVGAGESFLYALTSITWNYKYYGFITFDYIATYGATPSPSVHKLSILLVIISIYSITIRYLHLIKVIPRFYINYVVFPVFIYLSLFNYRDGIIAIILFFIFWCIREKKLFWVMVSFAFLSIFRAEFILLILVAFVSSMLTVLIKEKRLMNIICIVSFIAILLFMVPNRNINIESLALLVPSFNGVSLLHEILLFIDSSHYYSGFHLVVFTTVLLALAMFILKIVVLTFFFIKLEFLSRKDEFLSFAIFHFYLISLLIYTFLLDGMQDRIKTGFSIILVLAISLNTVTFRNENKFSIVLLVAFLLSVVIAFRNSRWLF